MQDGCNAARLLEFMTFIVKTSLFIWEFMEKDSCFRMFDVARAFTNYVRKHVTFKEQGSRVLMYVCMLLLYISI